MSGIIEEYIAAQANYKQQLTECTTKTQKVWNGSKPEIDNLSP